MAAIKYEITEDGFAIVRMVNGENRFRLSVVEEWMTALDTSLSNPKVKVLLTIGEGKFFSNGRDLEWEKQQDQDTLNKHREKMGELLWRILLFPIPTVAIINGHAFGSGAFLALNHDYRVMKPDRGWLNYPETALGMQFQQLSLDLIRAKIPIGVAQREAVLFSKRLSGREAKDLGLVDVLADESKLIEEGKRLATEALGKNGLGRDILHKMKTDLYTFRSKL